MDVYEFREQLIEDVEIAAKSNYTNPQDEFLHKITNVMLDAEEFDDFIECYYEGFSTINKDQRIDGYSFDYTNGICSVIISDYQGHIGKEKISSDEIVKDFEKILSFVGDSTREPIFKKFEESTEAYEFSKLLYELNKEILSFRFYLITDAFKEHENLELRKKDIFGKQVNFEIWDISRIFAVINSVNQKDAVEISIADFGSKGIPCVKAVECKNVTADIETDDDSKDNKITYTSYLAVVPGTVLHNLYYTFGNKLLEGNVRSFLSSKGKVNSSIQRTLIHYPDMFFAYNNGIAATASYIKTEISDSGLIITNIKDLQIVNGGQTTASITNTILNAKDGEHVDLSKIFIPMKISVLEHSMSEKIIPKISEYSNSQNKVDASDFFSNHPFHKRMEQLSLENPAPIVNGNQFHQFWFYERMRGQYLQGMMKFKARSSELNQYQQKFPKNQVIKMVDLAKYMELYEGYPHIVSKGKQALFRDFSNIIKDDWLKHSEQYNKLYFRKVVCIAIMFIELDNIIKQTSWYKEKHSYKANIVAYTLSLLFEMIRTKYPEKSINFELIWEKQTMYNELKEQVSVLSKAVYEYLTSDNRKKENVTEWCKDERCWRGAQDKTWSLSNNFINTLVEKASLKEKESDAKKDQKLEEEVNDMKLMLDLGINYWKQLSKWGEDRKLLTETDINLLKRIIQSFITGQLVNKTQLKTAFRIREKLLNDGMPIQF